MPDTKSIRAELRELQKRGDVMNRKKILAWIVVIPFLIIASPGILAVTYACGMMWGLDVLLGNENCGGRHG